MKMDKKITDKLVKDIVSLENPENFIEEFRLLSPCCKSDRFEKRFVKKIELIYVPEKKILYDGREIEGDLKYFCGKCGKPIDDNKLIEFNKKLNKKIKNLERTNKKNE